ncbi:MAG: hypothetical protein JRJ19_04935 [Deltaproteobacteria bacterium]|nr:hypothetical protein [Deltaproteobacteria bacterium]MBW1871386.1 hypothetical protein [Deltaproteobacteria bacterium]
MQKSSTGSLLVLTLSLILMDRSPIQAADTVETWAVWATNVDFYLGFEGIGPKEHDRKIYGDIMLGYGLLNRFSAYLGTTLLGNEYFSDGSAEFYLGIFGTPVDSSHFDLDMFLDISIGGPGLSQFQLQPSIELNFDLEPEQRSGGLYLRAGVALYAQDQSSPSPADQEIGFHVETTLGAYYTIKEDHQILLEYNMRHMLSPGDDRSAVEVGGIALGYNVTIDDSLEIISQLFFDIPQIDEPFSTGIMLGLIATLPSCHH